MSGGPADYKSVPASRTRVALHAGTRPNTGAWRGGKRQAAGVQSHDLGHLRAPRPRSRIGARHSLLRQVSLVLVFVVAAHPAHGLVAFVAALGRAVKDRVEAHQELGAAGVGGVAVVEGAVLARERAEPVSLGEIALEVGSGRPR